MAVPESETSTDPLLVQHLLNPAQLDYFDNLLVITVDTKEQDSDIQNQNPFQRFCSSVYEESYIHEQYADILI